MVYKKRSELGKSANADLHAAADFVEFCLKKNIYKGINPFRECLENYPIVSKRNPQRDIYRSARVKQLTSVQEEALHNRLAASVEDGRALGIALANGGGFPLKESLALTWADVVISADNSNEVVIISKDKVNAGATHNYSRAVFAPEAELIRQRYEFLLTNHTKEQLAGYPVVSARDS